MARRREITDVKEYGALIRVKPVTTAMVPPPDSVRLATGEYVGQSEFRKLSGPEQSLLMRSGVATFNVEQERLHKRRVKAYEAEKVRYEKTIIAVGPGKEPVLRSEFSKLTLKQQNLLASVGVEEFNKRQAVLSRAEAKKVRETLVELSTGEFVPKVEFSKLTPKQQTELRKLGIAAFNKKHALKPHEAWYTVEAPITPGVVPPGLVLTGKDEYVSEVAFKALTSAEQKLLKRLGVSVYNKQVEQEKKTWLIERGGVVGVVSEAEAARREAAHREAQAKKVALPTLAPGLTDAQIISQIKAEYKDATNIEVAHYNGTVDVTWEIPGEKLTVYEAYNQMLREGEIPLISKLITTPTEFEKTEVIEYEIPAAAPPPPDYKALEKRFLTESKYYQTETIASTGAGYTITQIKMGHVGYQWLSEANKKKVLEGYAQLRFTPAGEVARFKAHPYLLPLAKGMTFVGTVTGLREGMSELAPFRSPEEFGKTFGVAAKFVAGVIPVVGTVLWWDDMKGPEGQLNWRHALSVGLDIAILAPFARAGVVALRGIKAPIRMSATRLAKVEAQTAKRMVKLLNKAYGTEVGKSYAAMSKAQRTYLKRWAKVEELTRRGATTTTKATKALEAKLAITKDFKAAQLLRNQIVTLGSRTPLGKATRLATKAENVLTDKTRLFVQGTKGKVGFDSPAVTKMMDELPKEIVLNTRSAVESLKSTKANIKVLEAAVVRAEANLKAAQVKFPHDPSKWADLMYEHAIKQSQLSQTKVGGLNELYRKLLALREKGRTVAEIEAELPRLYERLAVFEKQVRTLPEWQATLRTAAVKSVADMKEQIAFVKARIVAAKKGASMFETAEYREADAAYKALMRANLNKEIAKLQAQVDKALKSLEIEWGRGGALTLGKSRIAVVEPKPLKVGGPMAAELTRAERAARAVTIPKGVVAAAMAPRMLLVVPEVTTPRVGEAVPVGKVIPITVTDLMLTPSVGKVTSITASELSKMSVAEVTTKFGDKISIKPTDVTAREALAATVLAVPKVIGMEWLSPAQAIARAEAIAVEAYTEAAIKAATEAATRAAQMNATEAATATAIETAIEMQLKPVTQTELKTEIYTRVATTLRTKLRFKLLIPPPFVLPEAKEVRGRKVYPAGTVVWKMGFMWKVIPPPYDVKKPISSRVTPVGVTVTEGTPQETLTFIGNVIPTRNISFDLGVTDGFINVKAQRIVFTGYGEETDVGLRMPSPTKGLTLRHVKPVRKYKKPRARSRPQVGTIRL